MTKTALSVLALVALSALFVGCGNTSQSATSVATPTPAPSPTSTCTPPPNTAIALVFPQPVPTANVPNDQQIVVAVAPGPLPTNWYGYVTSTFGNANGGFLTVAPTPLPTPTAAPSFANPTYETIPFGIFATGTTFQVFLANTNCYPGIAVGSFKT